MLKNRYIHFICFLLAGVMAVPVLFGMGQAGAKSITVNKKNFPDKQFRMALLSWNIFQGVKATRKDLKEVTELTMTAKNRRLNYKGIEHLPNVTHMYLTEWTENVKLPEVSRLKELYYTNHAMRQMSVEHFPQLKSVSVSGERLEKLDLSRNGQIRHLILEVPNLKGFAFSRLKKLTKLELFCQRLAKFDLSHNKKIKVLYLEDILDSSIELTSFPQLEELTINYANIETLDLTDLPNLKKISISCCGRLRKIRLRRCKNLATVKLDSDSGLCEIDADDSIRLKTLQIKYCRKMTHLDSLNLKKLKNLELQYTPIDNLSAEQFPKLKKLVMDPDGHPVFDFRFLKELVSLEITGDRTVRALDVSMLPKLSSLSWRDGVVEKVKFGKRSRFKKVDLFNNQLSGAWNLSKFKNIRTFDCSNNKITSLNLGKLDQKLEVYCSYNQLKKINAKYVKKLYLFECHGNKGVKIYLHSRKYKDSGWRLGKTAKVYYVHE